MTIANITRELESLKKIVYNQTESSAFYTELDKIATRLLEDLQVRDKSDLILLENVRSFLHQVKVLKKMYDVKLSREEIAILKNIRAHTNTISTKENMVGYMLTQRFF